MVERNGFEASGIFIVPILTMFGQDVAPEISRPNFGVLSSDCSQIGAARSAEAPTTYGVQ
jgi:hypothetical protein